MKVFDVQCERQHVFEAWLASEDDFQQQLASGLLRCPFCGSSQLAKRLSAPRLNLRVSKSEQTTQQTALQDAQGAALQGQDQAEQGVAQPSPTAEQPESSAAALPSQTQARLLTAMRHIVASAQDVGDDFARQARQMHHGELESRTIRGRVDRVQAQALVLEGVPLMPIPDFLKETLH